MHLYRRIEIIAKESQQAAEGVKAEIDFSEKFQGFSWQIQFDSKTGILGTLSACQKNQSVKDQIIPFLFLFLSPQKWKMAPMKEDFRNEELTFHYKDVFALSLIPFFKNIINKSISQ